MTSYVSLGGSQFDTLTVTVHHAESARHRGAEATARKRAYERDFNAVLTPVKSGLAPGGIGYNYTYHVAHLPKVSRTVRGPQPRRTTRAQRRAGR